MARSKCHAGSARAGAPATAIAGAVLGMQDLARTDTLEQRAGLGQRHVAQVQPAPGQVEPRDARPRAVACSATSRQSRLPSSSPASASVPGVTMRVTLRSTGPLLVAGSPICSQIATDSPEAHQLREILLDRVIGHAGHRNRRARRLSARGQRDVEQRRGALRVVEEELVEVAHAVEARACPDAPP